MAHTARLGGMTTANIGKPENLNIADLNNFHSNPRLGDVEAIAASLQANGQYKPIVVNRGTYTNRPMEVLAGNHTLKAMRLLTEREPDNPRFTEAACWVVDVDDDRANRIVLADNRTADLGTYQDDILKELLESLEDDFDGTGYSPDDVELLEGLTGGEDDLSGSAVGVSPEEKYSHIVASPTYEPTSDTPPQVVELYDSEKSDELKEIITAANLPEELETFLLKAAERHVVIDFEAVAEYYAHAPAHIQQLFEQQALVIPDFNDAIADGYIVLQGQLDEILEADKKSRDNELADDGAENG